MAGYLRRLTHANGLVKMPQLYDLLGTVGFSSTGGDAQWNALAAATGLSHAELGSLRLPPLSSSSPTLVDIGGLTVRANQMSMQHLSFCPICISENDHVPTLWFVHLATSCPKHDVQLIDRCANCSKTLRTDTVGLAWTCRSCNYPLADTPTTPASAAEQLWSSAMFQERPRHHPTLLNEEFEGLPAETRLAIAERIGSVTAMGRRDEPLRRKQTLDVRKADAIPSNRSIVDSRTIVEDAIDVLGGWPETYHALLGSLLDRAPYDGSQLPALRRMATKAGYLALRSLISPDGSRIQFLERENKAWLRATYRSEWGAVTTPPTVARFEIIEPYTLRAKKDASLYLPVNEALRMLGGGTQPARIANWIKAELLIAHRLDRAILIPIEDVNRTIRMLATLPPDDGRPGLVEEAKVIAMMHTCYTMEDFLIDVAIGHVGAFVRHRERTGLSSLAFDFSDLQSRRSGAAIASLAIKDETRRLTPALKHHFEVTWGAGVLNAERLSAAAERGHLARIRSSGTNFEYPVRSLITYLQGRLGLERAIQNNGQFRGGNVRPRDFLIRGPRHAGIHELTSYASCYTRF